MKVNDLLNKQSTPRTTVGALLNLKKRAFGPFPDQLPLTEEAMAMFRDPMADAEAQSQRPMLAAAEAAAAAKDKLKREGVGTKFMDSLTRVPELDVTSIKSLANPVLDTSTRDLIQESQGANKGAGDAIRAKVQRLRDAVTHNGTMTIQDRLAQGGDLLRQGANSAGDFLKAHGPKTQGGQIALGAGLGLGGVALMAALHKRKKKKREAEAQMS